MPGVGRLRRRLVVFALAAGMTLAVATGAIAGHETSGVKSYTGCLVSGDGVLIKIKEGSAPKSACSGGQVEAHFSGGDISKISVGSGLTLPNGGANGEVRIELAAGQSLPQGCAAERVAEWSGSAWVCGIDNNTTYTAGTGLNLSAAPANAFSIEPAYRVPGKACPTSGQFATGFDVTGAIQCQAPNATGVEVWQRMQPAAVGGGVTVLPKGEGVDVIAMSLPAGTFLMTGVATVSDRNSDDEVAVTCFLRDAAFNLLPVHEGAVDIGEGSNESTGVVTTHGVISLASANTVRFTCRSSFGDDDDDQADSATLTAMRVGTLHTP
jgi:hypothetical protein